MDLRGLSGRGGVFGGWRRIAALKSCGADVMGSVASRMRGLD